MTGYKILHLDRDGVLRSPLVRNFVWEVGQWMHAKPFEFLPPSGTFRLCDREVIDGLHCFSTPTALDMTIDGQRLAVVEGRDLISTFDAVGGNPIAHFRQMRITGWYTGNIKETW